MSMRQKQCRLSLSVLPWLLLILLIGLLTVRQHLAAWPFWNLYLETFVVTTLGLLLRAAPFLCVGHLVSAAVRAFLSGAVLRQMLRPGHPLGLLQASLLGAAFPTSDSDTVAIAERLQQQGTSTGAIAAFLLAAPVVNPIVLVATYQAFGSALEVAVLRGGCAWLLAIAVGDLLMRLRPELRLSGQRGFYQQSSPEPDDLEGSRAGVLDILQLASDRLFSGGSRIISAALVVSAWQSLLQAGLRSPFGSLQFLAIPLLMALAWLLAVPASGDAYLLWPLIGQFGGGALLAWLLLGPALNWRQLALVSSRLGRKFARSLFTIGLAATLVLAVLATIFGFGAPVTTASPSLLSITDARELPGVAPAVAGVSLLPEGPLVIDENNFLAMMEVLWATGSESDGREVQMVGFVYSDPSLGPQDFVLARLLVTDRVEEAAVAGLLCRFADRQTLPDGRWLQVQGTLAHLNFYDLGRQQVRTMPFIQVTQLREVPKPEQEYVYP